MVEVYRLDVRISREKNQDAFEFWESFKTTHSDCTSNTQLILRLIELYETTSLLSTDMELLSSLTVEKLSKKFRVMELRAGAAEKNTRILIEAMNGLLFHMGIDELITTDELHTQALQKAENKVARDINSIIKRNLESKREREAGNE